MAKCDGEEIMYKILERANLLNYYNAFVSQGGDDVQQLCEAGEEEFLEIMGLVGMATKPLKVQRLQRVLQEYATNPGLFHGEVEETKQANPPAKGSILDAIKKMGFATDTFENTPIKNFQYVQNSAFGTQGFAFDPSTFAIVAPKNGIKEEATVEDVRSACASPEKVLSEDMFAVFEPLWKSPDIMNLPNGSDCSLSGTPPSLIPVKEYSLSPYSPSGGSICTGLTEEQKASIKKAVDEILPTLPAFEVKKGRMKKIGNKEALKVLEMDPSHPEYLPLLRKYSVIYGRFDCKRHPGKPMSLHEYYVNEASAQICERIPALISRRNELFPIARAVVRKSGYKFTKGRSRAQAEVAKRGIDSSTPQKRKSGQPDPTQNSSMLNDTTCSIHDSLNGDDDDNLSLPVSEQENDDSLDHNLRLLQAYGMCELAEELRKNHAAARQGEGAGARRKHAPVVAMRQEDDIDLQAEWDKEVEEDSKVLAAAFREPTPKKQKCCTI